jgi:hypothetical protein
VRALPDVVAVETLALAPIAAATVPRLASASRMSHCGQVAEIMSTSSAISSPQPEFAAGGVEPPFWLILRKQPLAVVHGGNPNWLRWAARSDSAFGSSYASTTATVLPAPSPDGSAYALWRSAGPEPLTAASAAWARPARPGCRRPP